MKSFAIDCRRCERLATYLDQVKHEYPNYHAGPVAPFGDPNARLLIVGLAPGMHGANATGRPFTGDHAGLLLYATLYKYGFSNRSQSQAVDDGLQLFDCRITNAVKCLPPQNKPLASEINNCNGLLQQEIAGLAQRSVLLALGSIAHRAILKSLGLRQQRYPFGHGREHILNPSLTLLDSYHCSRYNTQTRRLTVEMFEAVFARVRIMLDD
ncbi:MAG: uracil-DNA glycosylase [Gammaproteobacteria bacterium]|nr:uracil-DNA glycosylase [Gammaproteobacteria bacterium]